MTKMNTEDTHSRMDFMGEAARKKLKAPPGWKAYLYQAMDDDSGSLLVEGSVPVGVKKSGSPKWDRKKGQRTVVTGDEIKAAKDSFEADTGLCHKCSGNGTEVIGWSRDTGRRLITCRKCRGTGRAAK